MPLLIPDRLSVVAKLQGYVRRDLPDLDPTVTRRRGFIGGFVRSLGSALHDWYVALKRYADYEVHPQTATEGFFAAGWWLDITNLPRLPAAAAQGSLVVTGIAGSQLASGSTITAPNSVTYTTDASVTVVAQGIRGTSTVTSEGMARFVTATAHNLASGMTLTFSGSPHTEMDGAHEIVVTDDVTVEYDFGGDIQSDPVEPNTLAQGAWGNVRATATITGPGGNIDAGSLLSINSPPTGIDSDALLTFGGMADGSDVEDLENWRERVLEALGTDFGMFSADEISIVAKTVPGVTRVFVRRPTREPTEGYPLEGQTRIAFLRDKDADPIPSSLEVLQVREKIHSMLVSAHTYPDDVEVLAPERYSLHVRFHRIVPDTPGMRASVRANLRQYLFETAGWGGVLEIDGLRCAIRAAFDADTGQALTSYELDTPTMDIKLPVDAYPVLTSITWTA